MKNIVFKCRVCNHQIFIGEDDVNFKTLENLTSRKCVGCSGGCWILDEVWDDDYE